MSEKRRDNKNRILQTGESQRKDGRYVYKYNDNLGQVNLCMRGGLCLPTKRLPASARICRSGKRKKKSSENIKTFEKL